MFPNSVFGSAEYNSVRIHVNLHSYLVAHAEYHDGGKSTRIIWRVPERFRGPYRLSRSLAHLSALERMWGGPKLCRDDFLVSLSDVSVSLVDCHKNQFEE